MGALYGSPVQQLLSAYDLGKTVFSPGQTTAVLAFQLRRVIIPLNLVHGSTRIGPPDAKGSTFPETHFAWISNAFMPFGSAPGQNIILPDSMLGLPPGRPLASPGRFRSRGSWMRPSTPGVMTLVMSQSLGTPGTKKRKRS